jgi:hypothetical protein
MTAYILLFSIPAWLALGDAPQPDAKPRNSNLSWLALTFVFSLAIGLRHEVGGDWINYKGDIEYFASLDLLSALTEIRTSDPAFGLLGWLSPVLGGDHFVNLVCGTLFTVGLVSFCRNQPNPWLAFTVAVPYLVTVVAMGYTRQGVAIGLSMLGLVALSRGRLSSFLLWIGVAAAFHKSAVILIPLAIFSSSQRKWSAIFGVAIVGSLAFVLFLQEAVGRLVSGYVSDGMESSGALIRVMMNALPSGLFLFWRRRFSLSMSEQSFWTWMSIGALLFIPALLFSPSSTAVDRVALYWIPIQIFVWARLPQAISTGPRSERLVRHSVVYFSLVVLLVWLVFAVNSFAWLPYRFYPWELIKLALTI